jgi:type I restriction enzyme S subunit
MPGKGIADVSDTAGKITEEGLAAISAQLLPVGTVLFSSRATIGKLGISRLPLATNQGFANFIPKNFVDAKYLAYCLLHYTAEITALAGSTTFKEVTKTALKKFKIPLPALSEQRRIVEILDQADQLRKKRAEADAKAARILPALFYKMFGDPATNPKGWPIDVLSKLVKVQGGYAFKNADFVEEGVLLVRIGNINCGEVVSTINSAHLPSFFCEEHTNYFIHNGDLLIALTGATTGKLGRFWLKEPALLNQRVGRFQPLTKEKEIINYLHLFMETDYAQNYIWQYARGFGQPNIAPRQIESMLVPVPPAELIHKFSVFCDKLIKKIKNHKPAKEKLETLYALLLHRAFIGDLTSKWREAHMKELLTEMETQAKALNVRMGS